MLPVPEHLRLTVSLPAGNELPEPVTTKEAVFILLAISVAPMALLPVRQDP